MKRFINVALFVVSACSITTGLRGGIIGGGGSGPPAKEQLKEILMIQSNQDAGIFTLENGSVNLGVNGPLDPEFMLAAKGDRGLKVSLQDLDRMSSLKSIDVVDLRDAVEQSTRSYRIDDGETLGGLHLRDRRVVMRESIK